MSRYSFKEKLEIAESTITILTFITAIWGSIQAFESGFFQKASHLVNYYHQEVNKIEQKGLNLEDNAFIEKLKTELKQDLEKRL